jgi:hypothetical protein
MVQDFDIAAQANVAKPQHWRGVRDENGWRGAPGNDFLVDFLRERPWRDRPGATMKNAG